MTVKSIIKKHIFIVCVICLILSIGSNVIFVIANQKSNQKFKANASNDKIPYATINTDLTALEFATLQLNESEPIAPEFEQIPTEYNNTNDLTLALIVNNQDWSIAYMDKIARENDYENYIEMVVTLIERGELFYIPEFTIYEYDEVGNWAAHTYLSTFTVSGTSIFEKAYEFNIIK